MNQPPPTKEELDREWIEQVILPRVWEFVATSAVADEKFKFTSYTVKDQTRLREFTLEQLQSAINLLVDGGRASIPPDSHKRNPQYAVNRELAISEFPPTQEGVEEYDDDTEGESATKSPKPKRRRQVSNGESKFTQHVAVSSGNSCDGQDDEEEDSPPRVPAPPPIPMPQGAAPCPVSEHVLSAVTSAVIEVLSVGGGETSKSDFVAQMVQTGIDAGEVQEVLDWLNTSSKIYLDDDVIYEI